MDQQQITALLQQALQPSYLDVVNESHMHASGKGANSHFKVIVVAAAFNGLRAVARHQKIYQLVQPQNNAIHALAIHAYDETEWREKQQQVLPSPNCMGHGD
ncbi:BolA family transcriptional regulator [Testudinibacter sp. TR-2022]|uniref:BolA family protein n=1 Tax=Testudinibacter sp. TR-2022 TaxID=2585029 RepID=UPI00111969A8|nr:BolA/IbaG family iron-sulfur metabolism protein [Testudinibacter sp. TR-2022]TNH04139.1 BolA family transcriptional regulator [Pasteurellaceae bacterium Phil31]TNH09771.1 BolA family transcriptional regulator [Testudinibacter sp. TR-2022]TNH12606.1 BolA family transcriptional regulator [Testudinibacter sp. TR-2022]TNH16166.1 BolA family transcriptional regulator [Testudinibacter sp. TR-2022]TNH18008.1 BolA family transcriptional regulator [Testudinibacter sp. TR-2022]